MSHDADSHDPAAHSRRRFLRQAVGTGLLLTPLGAICAQPSSARSATFVRSVSFVNTHTGEALRAEYCGQGGYEANCLAQVDHFLRDFRNGEVHPIDPHLLDILYELQVRANRTATYEVISGYRSPRTNAVLHKLSHGVAEHSLHMAGRAIDVRMEGFPTRKLRDLALSLRRGGVGYYARSDFVHIDTGRFRTWGG